ncbi:MAG: hypothetical protein PHV99_01605 [Candidatus Pacebacteria bacterium]|nr:hypothetical protein [Candidatus Paceibacterota bacterium]
MIREQSSGIVHATTVILRPEDRKSLAFPLETKPGDGGNEAFRGYMLAHLIYNFRPEGVYELLDFEVPNGQIVTTQDLPEEVAFGSRQIPAGRANGLFLEPEHMLILETAKGIPIVLAADFASDGKNFAVVHLEAIRATIATFMKRGTPPGNIDLVMPYAFPEDARTLRAHALEYHVRNAVVKNILSDEHMDSPEDGYFLAIKHNAWLR